MARKQQDLESLRTALTYMGHEHLANEVHNLSPEARAELFKLDMYRLYTVKQKLDSGIAP